LLATGNFQPTLYVHDGEQMTFFTLAVQGRRRFTPLQRGNEQRVPAQLPTRFCTIPQSRRRGQADVLIIEPEMSKTTRTRICPDVFETERSVAPKMTRLGSAPHLLK